MHGYIKQVPQFDASATGNVGARSCSGCTLCCSLLGVVELNKPVFKICKHCTIGKGCKIYEEKPQTCTDFACSYLTTPSVPEYWNPKICGMLLHAAEKVLSVICSAGARHRWKEEPYWSYLRRVAAALHAQGIMVRIVRKAEPVLVINPRTLDAVVAGALLGMEELPAWAEAAQMPSLKKAGSANEP